MDAVKNGAELLKILTFKRPDVVLLDLEMPILNGSKTLNQVVKSYPGQKIIIVSSYYDQELIKDVFNRGANAYISKNCDKELLIQAIRRVHSYGLYKDNIPCLLQKPAIKDHHYYRLIFTKREIEIIGLLCQAVSYKQIGVSLFISEKTVENHAKSIFKKISVKTRSEFGITATKLGLQFLGE